MTEAIPQDAVERAVDCVRRGELLAYPTETVWGLGADAASPSAVAKLRAFKGRGDAPISILISESEALAADFDTSAIARELAKRFWPGPLTLVVPCRRSFAAGVARDDGAVGVRCSSHPVASRLARALASVGVGPVTSTSLNRSGEPAAQTRERALAVRGAGGERAEYVLAGPDAGGEAASTVLDLSGATPRVLRWGGLPPDALTPVLEEICAA